MNTHLAPSENRSTKECEWKDGDRGGLAEWEKTYCERKKESESVS